MVKAMEVLWLRLSTRVRGRLGSRARPVTHRPRAKEVAKPRFLTRKPEILSSGFSALVWAPGPRASGP